MAIQRKLIVGPHTVSFSKNSNARNLGWWLNKEPIGLLIFNFWGFLMSF